MAPEMQPEDVALPRQQVVADVEPPHRVEVFPDDAIGDEAGEVGGRIAAVLDVVQRRGADLEPLLVLLVPFGHARVEVPAVIVEPGRVGDAANGVEVELLDLAEPDRDVGDLDAGVVDVVLDFDGAAREAEQSAEGIAERGVAEVADVRRLVRVDGGVLDDGLALDGGRRRVAPGEPRGERLRPVDEEVDVAVGRRLDPLDAGDGAHAGGELLRDRPRRLAEASCQLEGERHRQVAEVAARRDRDDDRRQQRVVGGNVIESRDGVGHPLADDLLNRKDHAGIEAAPETSMIRSPGCFTVCGLPGRLQPAQFLSPLVIMRRVDVHEEQTIGIAGRQDLGSQLLDRECIHDLRGLQLTACDALPHDLGRFHRPCGTERLIPGLGSRDDEVRRAWPGQPLRAAPG